MKELSAEILIHAKQVTPDATREAYEFILNEELAVVECLKVESRARGTIRPLFDIPRTLAGMLFELQHVRVNPNIDNTTIINGFIDLLKEIGVNVSNPPSKDSMAICFKPLGEISDRVRFYLRNDHKPVFLSPSMRPKLIYCKSWHSENGQAPG